MSGGPVFQAWEPTTRKAAYTLVRDTLGPIFAFFDIVLSPTTLSVVQVPGNHGTVETVHLVDSLGRKHICRPASDPHDTVVETLVRRFLPPQGRHSFDETESLELCIRHQGQRYTVRTPSNWRRATHDAMRAANVPLQPHTAIVVGRNDGSFSDARLIERSLAAGSPLLAHFRYLRGEFDIASVDNYIRNAVRGALSSIPSVFVLLPFAIDDGALPVDGGQALVAAHSTEVVRAHRQLVEWIRLDGVAPALRAMKAAKAVMDVTSYS